LFAYLFQDLESRASLFQVLLPLPMVLESAHLDINPVPYPRQCINVLISDWDSNTWQCRGWEACKK